MMSSMEVFGLMSRMIYSRMIADFQGIYRAAGIQSKPRILLTELNAFNARVENTILHSGIAYTERPNEGKTESLLWQASRSVSP